MLLNDCLVMKNDIEEIEVRDRVWITIGLPSAVKFLGFRVSFSSTHVYPQTTVEKKTSPTTLSTDLLNLLTSGDYTDLEIFCKDDKVIKCHKNILSSRSDVFKKMLDSDFKEGNTGTIKLDYMEFHIVQVQICLYQGWPKNPTHF